MSDVTFLSTSKSEWIKFRTVRSTWWGVMAMIVLAVGVGTLIDFALIQHSADNGGDFVDPVARSLAGHFFAEFVVGVLGALFITNEYNSGMIRTSLSAVPSRTSFALAKLFVMAASLLVVSEVICFTMFFIGQAVFSGHLTSYSIAAPGALRAVLLAGVYLAILGALGFALGLLLRRSAAAIVLFVMFLLIIPGLVHALPRSWSVPILRYMPNELGLGMMSINHAPATFTPWVCTLVMFGYVVALNAAAIYLLNRRDA